MQYNVAAAVEREGAYFRMPGMATAHSHAFQRALRGRTQRRSTAAGSFWSWRGLMYRLAAELDPEDIFQISRFAFVELAMSGVTAVGEFHYVHHDKDGRPYAQRTLLAERVIAAARAAGMRICLIRTAYLRGGYQQLLEPAQRRFADAQVGDVLTDVEALQSAYAGDPLVRIGVAAHSIRAVPLEAVHALAAYARREERPFHMHVAEQRRELEECRAEYGTTPIELLAAHDILDARFVGIHATHLTAAEIELFGQARAWACICRTTERDLGDGLPHTAALTAAGARLCVGVDSHAASDAFEEIRAVELDDRSRTEGRHVVAEAPSLLQMGTQGGYTSIGFSDAWTADHVYLRSDDASLAGADDEWLTDAVVFGATPRAVDRVVVNGQTIVADGVHTGYAEAYRGYLHTLRRLGLQ